MTPAGALAQVSSASTGCRRISGLLPEGRRLSVLRRSVKTSADDELSLLMAVGADAIGDVQVLPAGAFPGEVSPRVEFKRWQDVSFAEVFSAETGGSRTVSRYPECSRRHRRG